MNRLAKAVASAALVLTAVTSCSSPDGGAARLAVNGLVVPASQRTVTPDLRGTTLTGDSFDIRSWRGDVVVVNFWGSWCPPCREEAPDLQKIATERADKGVRFIGVDVRDSRDSAIAFENSFHVTYPSLFDPSSSQALALGRLAPQATPSTFVLDRQGRVAARFIGATSYRPLLATVDQVLAQG